MEKGEYVYCKCDFLNKLEEIIFEKGKYYKIQDIGSWKMIEYVTLESSPVSGSIGLFNFSTNGKYIITRDVSMPYFSEYFLTKVELRKLKLEKI